MSIAAPKSRLDAIDALRGAALAGMFIFHLIWDLGYFRLVSPDLPFEPLVMSFGHFVAGNFLFLVGVSLALSSRNGLDMGAFWRRLLMIGAAAAGVSAATFWLFPGSFIFFGILHCIALSSLLTLPLLRAPIWIVAAIMMAAFAAPLVIVSPVFDAPQFWWLGLGTKEPLSNDWRPLVPYFGVVLAGLIAARLMLSSGLPAWLCDWRAKGPASRTLALGGRHSLLVYLTHQPIFLVVIFMAARAFTPLPILPTQTEPFVSSCATQCVASGGGPQTCRNVCGCIASEIGKEPRIWERLTQETLQPADREAIDGFTRQCIRTTR